MPGGRYLTMLAGGSDGATQMTAIIASFSDSKVDASYANDEHATDTPSVSHTLIRWARDWWYVRTGTPHTAGATFMKAARYLAEQNQWAANYHPEYEQYAADLRLVRGYLEMATGLHNRPLRAPVKCFTCGEQALQRRYRDPNPCRHDGDHRTDCDQGGLEDNWRCAACARDYTPAEYLLAVKAKLEAQTDETVTT